MNFCEKYGYTPDAEDIDKTIAAVAGAIDSLMTEDIIKKCFSMMDMTRLNNTDNKEAISKFVGKMSAFKEAYPSYPLPASLCVFSNFVGQVAAERCTPDLHITAVCGNFPTGQATIDVKTLDCRNAVLAGTDEIDVLLPLGSFTAGDYEAAAAELRAMRVAIDEADPSRHVVLKVILETGVLTTPEAIAQASFLAMECGADFIKTSTGKISVNATPAAAYVMCRCIAAYHAATGRKVGFKPAGGITSAQDAMGYYCIVSNVLGKEWLNKSLFRFGVSRMANNLLSEIEKKTVTFF